MHYYSEPGVDRPVLCRNCGRWFVPAIEACAVYHQGTGCCHHGDTEVTAPPEGAESRYGTVGDIFGHLADEVEALRRRLDGDGAPLSPDEARALLRECVTVVAPGETLVIRAAGSWTHRDAHAFREHVDSLGLPFKVAVFPGEEFAVVRRDDAAA